MGCSNGTTHIKPNLRVGN